MPKKSSSSKGERVAKPRPSRKGNKRAQGTTPQVIQARLKLKIEDLTKLNNLWQTNYEAISVEYKRVLKERDVAQAQLKSSEETSAARLLLIHNELPDFPQSLLEGQYDCYYEARL